MAERTIMIDGREVAFKATAALPRIYRMLFNRDIYTDMYQLEKDCAENRDKEKSAIAIESLEIFEDVAYAMAKHASPDVPKTIVEWLDQFELFSIYEVLPSIVALWNANLETHVEAKKNSAPPQGN